MICFGARSMRLQEQVDEQPLDGHRIVTDLVIARRLQAAQLQPVQRRLAGHRRAILAPRFELARQHRHHRIVAQFVVVVEILVAKRDPEHPLPDQRHHLVLDQFRTPHVVKARRKPIHQPDRAIRRAQKQRTGIRRDRATIERRHHLRVLQQVQIQTNLGYTLSASGRSSNQRKSLSHNNFR